MTDIPETVKGRKSKIRWLLVLYDFAVFLFVCFVLLYFLGGGRLGPKDITIHSAIFCVLTFAFRIVFDVYRQIWRYGGISAYIKLIIADAFACIVYFVVQRFLLTNHITAAHAIAMSCTYLLGCLVMRMIYRYAYEHGGSEEKLGSFLAWLLRVFSGGDVKANVTKTGQKIRIAIVGAGVTGTSLAEELLASPMSSYKPVFFIDTKSDKIGRAIHSLTVVSPGEATGHLLREMNIQEVVIAIPGLTVDQKRKLYEYYSVTGCKIKVYDYPLFENAGGKRRMREFDVEELLFRQQIIVADERTADYYKDKTVLITGGGGSIGSELCRQIAKMQPKKIVILDIYENGAYDVQQELKIKYGKAIDIVIEIVSVTNKTGLERVFREHRPQVVINAAAHKHVPLMERNVIEAVENNVFGTLNTVLMSEKYEVERFMMVSTDKAVNPTNVMGATKRMCEMIVLSHAKAHRGVTTFSATRFGNVLGSAGSVIPLFKRQIQNGGPVTITDFRIIRYFMTIPEAAQLVLESASKAKNGELFVLDMGQPVKIYDLAVNMIKLSGMTPGTDIELIETGLRPGEKLYEELLIKTENLEKTDNSLIFIERDDALDEDEIEKKLEILRNAVSTDSDAEARAALMTAVPTFRDAALVNAECTRTENGGK